MPILPEACLRALRYYIGEAEAWPGLPADAKAYATVNALFFPGIDSERTRALEGKPLNARFLRAAGETEAFCRALLTALRLGGADTPKAVVYRVDRETDVRRMREAGRTVSFTSACTTGFLGSYADKKALALLEIVLPAGAPRAEMARLLPDYSKPQEAEALLPPGLPLTFAPRPLTPGEAAIRDMDGHPPVGAWTVTAGTRIALPADPCAPPDPSDAAAGARVYQALLHGRAPAPADIDAYTRWKRAFVSHLYHGS